MHLGCSLAGLWLGILLFCDDMVIAANSAVDLQRMIDVVKEHSDLWRYSFAVEKCKVMTISVPFKSVSFTIAGSPLEEVTSYRYLGGIIHRFLRDKEHWDSLLQRVKSAVETTLHLGVRHFSLKTCILLFNSLIASTGSYGSELFVCSPSTVKKFDVLMRRYFKRAIGCSISTHNAVFCGELSIYSFSHRFSLLSLYYFWHVVNCGENALVSLVFTLISADFDRDLSLKFRGRISYLESIKRHSSLYGINLNRAKTFSELQWKYYVKSKLEKFVLVEWTKSINSSVALSYEYVFFKSSLVLDSYILSQDSYTSRLIFKLRSGSNALAASTGRYEGITRFDRICVLCNSASVEDTVHFCCFCPFYDQERSLFFSELNDFIDSLQISSDYISIMHSVFSSLHSLDLLRILLCGYQNLSFSISFGFRQWWPLIERVISRLSFKCIYSMYRKRLEAIHGN